VCALVLRFSSFALSNRETRTQPWQHKGDQAGRDFFLIYIYIFRKKNEKRLVADAEETSATAVVAFVLSMHYYDAQILSCFNPPSLVLLPSTRLPFLFFSFFSLFFLPPFPSFSYSLLE
jgi:hypothetical protein